MIYDKQIAMKLYDQFNIDKAKYIQPENYYNGKTVAQATYPENAKRCNRKFGSNHVKMFIDEEVSYMTGNRLVYSSKSGNSKIIKDIEDTIDNINYSLDSELATTLLIYSKAYEVYYLDENKEFKIKVVNPMQGIAYTDVEGKAQLFLYFYKKMLDDKTYIDVFDDKYIYHFDESFNKVDEPQTHYFGRCPVGVAELNNGVLDTIYNQIHGLQDDYEFTLMDWSNEIGDTRLSYLTMTGCSIDDEQASEMKERGIITTEDANSKVAFLIKDIKPEFLAKHREIVEEEMYKVTQHLKNQITVQSNTSGTMLAVRLNCLRIKLTTQYQCLKNCIRTRLQCLFTYLYQSQNKLYDYRDLDVKFTLNLPNNDYETAQIISLLSDKVSIKGMTEKLSWITNADQDFKEMLAEKKQIQDNQAPPKLSYDNNSDIEYNLNEDNNGQEEV